jgi:hypothetical protein
MFLFKPNIKKMKELEDVEGLLKAHQDTKSFDLKLEIEQALVEIGLPAVDPSFKMKLYNVLARIGLPILPTIVQALESQDWHVQSNGITALWGLVELKPGACSYMSINPVVEVFLDMLENPKERGLELMKLLHIFRDVALYSTKEADRALAIDCLEEGLKCKDQSTRRLAAEALGKIGGVKAVKLLQNALQDKSEMVSEEAGEALMNISETGTSIHSLVASSNQSLIRTFHNFFEVGARTYGGSAACYRMDPGRLSSRQRLATSLPQLLFVQAFIGSTTKEVLKVADALGKMEAAGSTDIFIAYIVVDPTGEKWVQEVYTRLLNEAVMQGILPFSMYQTKNKEAADFLIGSFSEI